MRGKYMQSITNRKRQKEIDNFSYSHSPFVIRRYAGYFAVYCVNLSKWLFQNQYIVYHFKWFCLSIQSDIVGQHSCAPIIWLLAYISNCTNWFRTAIDPTPFGLLLTPVEKKHRTVSNNALYIMKLSISINHLINFNPINMFMFNLNGKAK